MEHNNVTKFPESSVPMPLNERHRLKSLAVIALLLVGVLWLIAAQFHSFTQRNGAPPEGWSWSSIVTLNLLFIYGLIRTTGNYYRDSNTVITGEGVMQRTLCGTRVLRWTDVHEFSMIGYTMHFHGAVKMSLNTAAYAEPCEVIVDRVTGYISKASGEEDGEEEINEEYSSPPPDTRVI